MKKMILENNKMKIIYDYYKKIHKTELSFEEFLFVGANKQYICKALSFYSTLELHNMNEKEIEKELAHEISSPYFHEEIEDFVSDNEIGKLNEISFDFDNSALTSILEEIKEFQPLTAKVINLGVIEKILDKKTFYAPDIKFNTISECIDGFIDYIFEEYTGDFSPSPMIQRKEYIEKLKIIEQKVKEDKDIKFKVV